MVVRMSERDEQEWVGKREKESVKSAREGKKRERQIERQIDRQIDRQIESVSLGEERNGQKERERQKTQRKLYIEREGD